jgi:hypothetical protein
MSLLLTLDSAIAMADRDNHSVGPKNRVKAADALHILCHSAPVLSECSAARAVIHVHQHMTPVVVRRTAKAHQQIERVSRDPSLLHPNASVMSAVAELVHGVPPSLHPKARGGSPDEPALIAYI